MKSFKKLFTSKPKTHNPESSFKIGGMGSLKVLDVIPSPEDDSHKLKKAFQGFGTDEDGIIEILGHRDANQRKKIGMIEISDQFKTFHACQVQLY